MGFYREQIIFGHDWRIHGRKQELPLDGNVFLYGEFALDFSDVTNSLQGNPSSYTVSDVSVPTHFKNVSVIVSER